MRVVLADDSPDVRTALRLVIQHQSGCEICGEAADSVQLLALCAQTCPDVIVVDAELSGLSLHPRHASMRELAQTLRRLCSSACIIALTSYSLTGRESWSSFVDAAFAKSDPPDTLLDFLKNRISPHSPAL